MTPDAKTKAFVIAMRKRGHTWSAIAREFNLTKNQVAGILHRAGLSKPKEKKDDKGNYPRVA